MLMDTMPRRFRVPLKLHAVPAEIVLAGLRRDLDQIAGPGWYAVLLMAEGWGIERGAGDWCNLPDELRRDLMRRLAIRLNHEMPNSGHWVVAWNTGEDELVVLYRDADGDLQFTVDFQDRWSALREMPFEHVMQRCQEAFDHWFLIVFKGVEVKPEQTVKQAQGQAPTRH